MHRAWLLLSLLFASAAFYAGMLWQEESYKDICLDMGGGMAPEGYPICVVEHPSGPDSSCPDPCSMVAGSWVEPVPGNKDMVQGFILYPDGSARSINMSTLLYKSWRTHASNVTFLVESIGIHNRFETEESYRFEMPDPDRLILRTGNFVRQFRRMGSEIAPTS